MLEIKKVYKEYKTDSFKQIALNGVSICFRDNEFASILGPSGSGKTTLLNIIGGLDKYTKGDLIINGVSTKNYKDRDWDTYRNHKIGFIFQSYNLIPHQSVLRNVELALTLAGISKQERKEKAKEALIKVGLKDHINKRPNQLSGGQMQRVAIARALVNNPDILLADEPTGALDSTTSVQIMELLKEVARDKLVIMVTHNPELAKEYSSRIIELKDGNIISDNNPYKNKSKIEDKVSKIKKTSMSFMTALGLSFNNLMVKKKRTFLVSFAGSIGIIGIALILSLSTGFQNYIDKLQEDTLTSYPLTITKESTDITGLLLSMVDEEGDGTDENIVKEKQYISDMFSNVKSNDLKNFKKYLNDNIKSLDKDISSVKYSYSVNPLIYTFDAANKLARLNPSSLFSSFGGSGMYSFSSIFNQMVDDMELINKDYEVLAGKWPTKYNEMIIVLSDKNTISDMLVYSLGLRSTDELSSMMKDVMAGKEVSVKNDAKTFTYDDLMNIKLKLINPADLYEYNSKYKIYEDMSEDSSYMKKVYNNGEDLKIVGVVAPKDGSNSMALSPGVAYTSKLTEHVINKSSKTEIVKKQLLNTDVDVFSNNKFDEANKKSNLDFQDMISIDKAMLSSAFGINLDSNKMSELTSGYMEKISSSITADTTNSKADFASGLEQILNGFISDYANNPVELIDNNGISISLMSSNKVDEYVSNYMNTTIVSEMLNDLEEKYVIPSNVFFETYSNLVSAFLKSYIVGYSSNDMSFTVDPANPVALFNDTLVNMAKDGYLSNAAVIMAEEKMAQGMVEALMQKSILSTVGDLTSELVKSVASSFNVDENKIANAFKFTLSEQELSRIMNAMSSNSSEKSSTSNLLSLGYQDIDDPTVISLYFTSFESKERVLSFIDDFNESMKNNNDDDKVINYTDTTGILMRSVKKIVDSVSYVLIAFVSISLIVSSIMIGIITYISVLERTKEIGILRAIGASKRNISSIFNAETFIIGLLSGSIGILVSNILLVPINIVIHNVTDNLDITAVLPILPAILLVILSVILTLIGGIIPSKIASKKDPVEALRTE